MPELVLGPLLRYVGETEAVVWVETDAPVRGRGPRRARAHLLRRGHHYALVRARRPRARRPATSTRCGSTASRPGRRRTRTSRRARSAPSPADGPLRIAFGSCRVPRRTSRPTPCARTTDERGREIDALLRARAADARATSRRSGRDLLLLLGDQVYADEVSPGDRARSSERAATPSEPPGERGRSTSRSTRGSTARPGATRRSAGCSRPCRRAMIFDDHDVHDDWNISAAWVEEMRAAAGGTSTSSARADVATGSTSTSATSRPASSTTTSCSGRCAAADDGAADPARVRLRADRGRPTAAAGATAATSAAPGSWSIDSRAGRVLDEGQRSMVDEEEWDWIDEHATRRLRPPAARHLAAVPARAAACTTSRPGTRRSAAAPGAGSPRARARSCAAPSTSSTGPPSTSRSPRWRAAARGRRRASAASRPRRSSMLSGDVHHAYLAEVAFPRAAGVRSAVYQAVCSPFRNPLDAARAAGDQLAMSRPAAALARLLARAAGVPRPRRALAP